ncbi:MAG: glycine/D-amino acid oxidase-like deaminating enzyme [Oceanospirillaceae bacterium]
MNNLWHQCQAKHTEQTLSQDLEVDVAIVGAGYSGLSTALHLAEQGVKVAVLEAQHVGYGASGRNVGLTNPGLWIMPQQTEKLLGKTQGQAVNQLLIDAPNYVKQLITKHQLDCDFLDNGTLHLAHSKSAIKYLKERRQQLLSYGAKIDLLDSEQTFSKTQATGYHGALLDNRAGTLQPLKYCYALAHLAQLAGVQIFSESPVLRIEKESERFALHTAKGKIKAEKIVLATNAYETNLKQNDALYTPLYYCQLASEPLTAQQREHCLPDNNGCWDSGAVMRSFRTDSSGRLIVGTVGNIHTQSASGFKRWSKHVVANTFKNLDELEYSFAWSGRIAKSHNNIPQVLELEPNIVQIMGYSGRGIAGATVIGRELANYLNNKIDRQALALPVNQAKNISFNQVRAAVYEVGSQLSHLSDHLIR